MIKNALAIFICILFCACDSNTNNDKKQNIESNKIESKQELDIDRIVYYGKIGLKAALKINKELSGKWEIIKEKTQQDKSFPFILAHKLIACVAFDAMGRDVVLDFDRLEVVNHSGGVESLTFEDIAQFQDLYEPILNIINYAILNHTSNKE